ncbi:MAG: SGNH/GDSL hydrolase family protein [Spirulina sp.]
MKISSVIHLAIFLTGILLCNSTATKVYSETYDSPENSAFLAEQNQDLDQSSTPLRIMPLGDSITYGTGAEGGYRSRLWAEFLAENRAVDFVGSQSYGSVGTDLDHEGHPGKTIQFLRENIVNWLGASDPDVILLMIGTNDILYPEAHDFAQAPYRIGALIDQITLNAPNAKLLVASVSPLGDPLRNEQAMGFNAEIEAAANRYANRGRSVYFVDMSEALTPTDLVDGIHPNADGYDRVAQTWHSAILEVLE